MVIRIPILTWDTVMHNPLGTNMVLRTLKIFWLDPTILNRTRWKSFISLTKTIYSASLVNKYPFHITLCDPSVADRLFECATEKKNPKGQISHNWEIVFILSTHSSLLRVQLFLTLSCRELNLSYDNSGQLTHHNNTEVDEVLHFTLRNNCLLAVSETTIKHCF